MRISFFTFGCTVNNYESQELSRKFVRGGDVIAEQGDTDVIIINSCVVTGAAENGATRLCGRLRKRHPDALIVMTGCYNEYVKRSGKPASVGHGIVLLDKSHPDMAGEIRRLFEIHNGGAATTSGVANAASPVNAAASVGNSAGAFRPVRALIQIQTGCGNDCAYCVVPRVRGGSSSTPYDAIKAKLDELTAAGFREFVLAGLNLGTYYFNGMTLIDVMEKINAEPEVESIRLSSLEPMNIEDTFIKRLPLVTKLNPHLHISLQSGCDRTLARMNRNYDFESFESTLGQIRTNMPGVAITTDIIVGFPGESEGDFGESIGNIVKCRFADIHIFKFSPRNGTPASAMEGQITEHRKNERANLLKGVKAQTRYNFYSAFIGKNEKMTPIRLINAENWEGVTAHNFPVAVAGGAPSGRVETAFVTGMDAAQEAYTAVKG